MIITGFHAIEEALKHKRSGVLLLSAKNPRTLLLEQLARKVRIEVKYISSHDMLKLGVPESTRAILKAYSPTSRSKDRQNRRILRDYLNEWQKKDKLLVLILDGITDTHNFGAILRSAHMFSVDLVLTPKHNTATINETVYRTSSGACEHVPVLASGNLRQSIELLKKEGFWIYSAELKGQAISKEDFALARVGLIMGSEHRGPRQLTRQISDAKITIPCQGKIDSLNVSVATGILLYEIRRQQQFFG